MSDLGWFAENAPPEDTPPPGRTWRPALQLDGFVMAFDAWFAARGQCEEWIRTEVIGRQMLEGP